MSIRNKVLMGVYAITTVAGIALTVTWSTDVGMIAVLLTNMMLFGVVIFQRYQLGKVQQRSLTSLQLENVMLPRISARSAKILQRLETLDATFPNLESKLNNSFTQLLTELDQKHRRTEDSLTRHIVELEQKKHRANDNLATDLSISDKKIIGLLHAQQLHIERLNEKLESVQRSTSPN